jgi:hypothetical protein
MSNKKMNYGRAVTTLLIIVLTGFTAAGQVLKKVPYYINLNSSTGTKVHEITDETLALQYTDAYGRWKDIPLKITDAEGKAVAAVGLGKVYGLNSFVISLKDVYSGWKQDHTYFCELKDEQGKLYELLFRLVEAPEKPGPVVNIVVNPEQMDCDDLSYSVVKFYGDIKGGKPPYVVNWYVLNNERTDFLYQPREQVLEASGKTPVITVDKTPDYYVVLYVKDACGNEEESVVQLVCEDKRKKINTIFVEQLGRPLPVATPGN